MKSNLNNYFQPNVKSTLSTLFFFCGQNTHAENRQKIENVQKGALNVLLDGKESSYETTLSKYGMKTLLLQRTRLIATQIFKSVNGYNPISMRSMVLP